MIMSNCLDLSFVLVIILLSQPSHEDAPPRVQTKLGVVVGSARQSYNGKMIYSFEGIPYIKPPVGDLRFKPPVPAEPWTGDFPANNNKVFCPQNALGPLMGTEDCVKLNVYTPWDASSCMLSEPLSVMVFFHAGFFVSTSSSPFFIGLPDYLLHHDVILVTVNFRIGVLGFLSTEDEAASGNYGLLDQVEALKWIKNNIASFGGNPNEITIFGQNSGAASVHYLMLSPLAKGLFHRAIAESGTSLNPWAATNISKKNARALAKKLGCPEQPSKELVKCLRGKSVKELVDTDIMDPAERCTYFPLIWSPRVDSEAANPFLPKRPIELMSSGDYSKVPLLIGHNKDEGAVFIVFGKQAYNASVHVMKTNWDLHCKLYFAMREFLVEEKLGTELCNKVKDAYIKNNKTVEENKLLYADIIGDGQFTSGVLKSAELMSKHSPVYSYLFKYESNDWSLAKVVLPTGVKVQGLVTHSDELLYLQRHLKTGWTKKSPEYAMVEMMSGTWTNFAKTGIPSISKLNAPWPKATWPNHKYVVIDSRPSIQQNYSPDKMKLFDEIYSNSLYKTTKQTK